MLRQLKFEAIQTQFNPYLIELNLKQDKNQFNTKKNGVRFQTKLKLFIKQKKINKYLNFTNFYLKK